MTIEQKRKELRKLLEEGKTLSEIGRKLFNSTGTGSVNSFIEKYGIPIAKYNKKYCYMDPEWLKEKLNELKTPNEIAKKYNMSRTSITRYAIKYGLYELKFKRKSKNEINENYFDKIDNARKAYWLGFIMADGSIYHYKNDDKMQFEIKIQEKDKKLLEEFAQDISFPLDKIKTKEEKRCETITVSVSLRTYNKNFCNSLIKYGITDLKSGNETFPKKMLPVEFYKDFVRGLWDGDGSVSDKRLYIGSMSLNLISQLSKFFASSDIMHYLDYDLTKINKKTLYRLYISAQSWEKFKNLIYYQGCLGLDRKIKIINNIRSTKYGE